MNRIFIALLIVAFSSSTVFAQELAGGAIPLPPPGYGAPQLAPVMESDAQRTANVIALLEYRARTSRSLFTVVGATYTALGAVVIASGLGCFFAHTTYRSDGQTWDEMGVTFLAIGPLLATIGIGFLMTTDPANDRARRYVPLLRDGMSEAEFAAIGGELQSDARQGHFSRMIGAFAGFGLAVGGLAMFIGSAASSHFSSDQRLFGYVEGGLLALVGGGLGGLELGVKTVAEKDYDTFMTGGLPEGYEPSTFTLQVAPTAFRNGGGLAFSGTF